MIVALVVLLVRGTGEVCERTYRACG